MPAKFENNIHLDFSAKYGTEPPNVMIPILKTSFSQCFLYVLMAVLSIYSRNATAATTHRVDEGFGCSDQSELRQQPQNTQRGDLLTCETRDAKYITNIGGSMLYDLD